MIMDDILHHLEKKIKDLIDQHHSLKNANEYLVQGKSILHREKNLLLAKQEKAISQIKTLISKLKAIEK